MRVLTRQDFLSAHLHPDDGLHGHLGPRDADRVRRQVDRLEHAEGALRRDLPVAGGMRLSEQTHANSCLTVLSIVTSFCSREIVDFYLGKFLKTREEVSWARRECVAT